MNTNADNQLAKQDRLSTNVISEGLSRTLSLVAGLASSVILVRSIDSSSSVWTEAHYNSLRYLTALGSILMPIILIGFTTAIIKVISEHSGDEERLPEIISFSFVAVTVAYVIVLIVTTVFGESIGWLSFRPDLKIYWVLVIVMILPSAYLRLIRSIFSGFQRMKLTLIADTVYNSMRLVLLLYLYLTNSFSIPSMLWLVIIYTSSGLIFAIGLVVSELHRRHILRFKWPSREIIKPIATVGSTFLVLSLLSANVNQVPIIFADIYKANSLEYLSFNISQSITFTIRSILMAPVAILLPNLTLLMRASGFEEVRERFNQFARILMPIFLFASLMVYVYGYAILGALYGTERLVAFLFLQAFSIGLFVVGLTNIYSSLITSMGRMRVLLVLGCAQAIIQITWIIVLAPVFGIIAIAYWWVTFIPLYLMQHYYCRTRFKVTIRAKLVARALVIGFVFLGFAFLTSESFKTILLLVPLHDEIYYIAILALAIPLWYIFLTFCMIGGLMNRTDMQNLAHFLRRIPPAWWVSRPFISRIERIERKRNTLRFAPENG